MLKVLFINNFAQPDYLSNMIYMGLAAKQDVELYTYAMPFHLIKGIGWDDKFVNNTKWEGVTKIPGFTVCGKVSKGPYIDYPEEIKVKIKDEFYDIIIFSNVWKDQSFLDLILTVYNKNDIIFIDGDDHELIIENLVNKGIYLKRELYSDRTDVKPISMAVPDEVHLPYIPINKTQLFATVVPCKQDTYIFKDEHSYYFDYYKSYYGVTFKKGGWDCMRHYEILANKCIPYFVDLKNCPKNTLVNWPKKLILETNEYAKSHLVPLEYDYLLEELGDYVKRNMTTRVLANYLIESAG